MSYKLCLKNKLAVFSSCPLCVEEEKDIWRLLRSPWQTTQWCIMMGIKGSSSTQTRRRAHLEDIVYHQQTWYSWSWYIMTWSWWSWRGWCWCIMIWLVLVHYIEVGVGALYRGWWWCIMMRMMFCESWHSWCWWIMTRLVLVHHDEAGVCESWHSWCWWIMA